MNKEYLHLFILWMTWGCHSLGNTPEIPFKSLQVHNSLFCIHFPFALLAFKILHLRFALEIRSVSHQDPPFKSINFGGGEMTLQLRIHRAAHRGPGFGSYRTHQAAYTVPVPGDLTASLASEGTLGSCTYPDTFTQLKKKSWNIF